jgi:ankyrin repeat protein
MQPVTPRTLFFIYEQELELDVMDEFGRTTLLNACIGLGFSREQSIAAVNVAIDTRENLDLADLGGWTALHFAAQNNDAEVCELLLDAGGFVDPIDSFGNTPLWRAVLSCRGDGDCIRVFLTYDANPLLENLSGISPVKLARTIGNYDVERFFSDF